MYPFISVVIPTRNNEGSIGNCLRSLNELDYPKDRMEIIISDGMSVDKTREIAEQLGAKVILDRKNSVCSARNIAFAVARGEFIAISDDDCVMDKNWLKNSLKYFNDSQVGGIGGANLIPEDDTNFGKAVGLIFAYAPYIIKAAHTRVLKKVIESRSHGSNAIYRAEVLKRVTPIDESFIQGEDIIMNQDIEALGYKLLYVPDVIVKHYRRPNIKKWWKQMYAYGMGRAFLPRKRKGEAEALHIITGLAIPIGILAAGLLAWLNPLYLLAALVSLIILAILLATVASKSLAVGLNMPVVLAVFFCAWSYGYIHELFFPSIKEMK